MAHFAELDDNNIVIRVIVVDNNKLLDENRQENEETGIYFLKSLFGENTKWKQCSYNGNFRENYPGPNYYYDEIGDFFVGHSDLRYKYRNEYLKLCEYDAKESLTEEESLEKQRLWEICYRY